ncbi:MAG: DUF488 domain-containing protein, partial [Sphingobacteriales bacterium]
MLRKSLYSIGHGNRKIESFIELIRLYNIQYVIDVRSQPYSKFNPDFNQDILKNNLQMFNITYVFMGDSIGGRPLDKSCYDADGKVDYERVKNKPFFKDGISRLKTAYNKNIPIVVMCSES